MLRRWCGLLGLLLALVACTGTPGVNTVATVTREAELTILATAQAPTATVTATTRPPATPTFAGNGPPIGAPSGFTSFPPTPVVNPTAAALATQSRSGVLAAQQAACSEIAADYARRGQTFDPRVDPQVVANELFLMDGYTPGSHTPSGDYARQYYTDLSRRCYGY